jgi:hypothetical protein
MHANHTGIEYTTDMNKRELDNTGRFFRAPTMVHKNQRLKLALSKGSGILDVSLPSPHKNGFHFRNVVFSSFFRIPEGGQNLETK